MSFGGRTAPRWLVSTLVKAAEKTGVDPVYLMTLADVESSLEPQAKAPTSSAEGLFQFIDQTWLEVLYHHAEAHGFAEPRRRCAWSTTRSWSPTRASAPGCSD